MKKILVVLLFSGVLVYLAYEVLIDLDDNFKYGRMRETVAVRPHEEAPLLVEEGVVPVDGSEAILKATKGEDLVSPFSQGDLTALETGKKLYFIFCAQCHGKDHDGNGTVGQSFYPLPTDLRSEKVQSLPDGVFFKEVSYGIPDGRQPPLATTIEASDRWRIIAYVKSLGVR